MSEENKERPKKYQKKNIVKLIKADRKMHD